VIQKWPFTSFKKPTQNNFTQSCSSHSYNQQPQRPVKSKQELTLKGENFFIFFLRKTEKNYIEFFFSAKHKLTFSKSKRGVYHMLLYENKMKTNCQVNASILPFNIFCMKQLLARLEPAHLCSVA
jgi:hypothetical protein